MKACVFLTKKTKQLTFFFGLSFLIILVITLQVSLWFFVSFFFYLGIYDFLNFFLCQFIFSLLRHFAHLIDIKSKTLSFLALLDLLLAEF